MATQVRIDGGASWMNADSPGNGFLFTPTNGTLRVFGLAPGAHVLEVRAVDAAAGTYVPVCKCRGCRQAGVFGLQKIRKGV